MPIPVEALWEPLLCRSSGVKPFFQVKWNIQNLKAYPVGILVYRFFLSCYSHSRSYMPFLLLFNIQYRQIGYVWWPILFLEVYKLPVLICEGPATSTILWAIGLVIALEGSMLGSLINRYCIPVHKSHRLVCH